MLRECEKSSAKEKGTPYMQDKLLEERFVEIKLESISLVHSTLLEA